MNRLTALAACLLTLGACSDSEYDLENIVPEQYNKILYINGSGKQDVTLFDTEEDNTYSFSVFKAGSNPELTANVNITALTQAEVDTEYSDIEGVDYKVINPEYYTIDATRLDFTAEDRYKIVTLSIRPQLIKADMEAGDPDSKWVIPLRATSEKDSVNADKDELFLMIDGVIMPALGFTTVATNLLEPNGAELKQSVGVNLDTDNKWDIDGTLTVDADYVDTYNKDNATGFQLLPEGTYTIPEMVSLKSGLTNTTIQVTVNGAAIAPGDYLLPIRISDVSRFEISKTQAVYPLKVRVLGNKADRTGWTAEANTYEQTGEGASGAPSCMLDGNMNTYWHSAWQTGPNPGLPYEIIIDMKDSKTLTHVAMSQRQNTNYTDTGSGVFYISDDKTTWTEIGGFSMKKIIDAQTFGVLPVSGRYLKIRIETSHRGNNCSLTEVDTYTK